MHVLLINDRYYHGFSLLQSLDRHITPRSQFESDEQVTFKSVKTFELSVNNGVLSNPSIVIKTITIRKNIAMKQYLIMPVLYSNCKWNE